MKTRSQMLAASAFEQVSQIAVRDEQKKYGSMAHKLPVLIRSAGLAQALAFVATRPDEPQRKLLDHLAVTLGFDTGNDLLTSSRETESLREYIHLTRRALDALLWYKRFAQSVLNVESGADEDNDDDDKKD